VCWPKPVLHLDPSSLSTFQTLLFLHLHTDDYPAAIELLFHPPEAASSLEFERAYCLYRLHREKEALVVLEGLSSRGRKEEHLEAQIVSAVAVLVLQRGFARLGRCVLDLWLTVVPRGTASESMRRPSSCTTIYSLLVTL
jgi:hypothetical protein